MTPQEIENLVDSQGDYNYSEGVWISTGKSLHGEQDTYDDGDPAKLVNFLQYEYWVSTDDGKLFGADSIEELLERM